MEGKKAPRAEARDLCVHFGQRAAGFAKFTGRRAPVVHAVDDVSLEIGPREVVGLVGESGSGKTTLGKALLRLVPVTSGQVLFDGDDVSHSRGDQIRQFRRQAQMIFQDPHASLSPRLTISQLLEEPYRIHRIPEEDRTSVAHLLETVELSSELANKYPHELSGGQARRVGIARALALHPKLLIADEPTAGLDVSAIGNILNLMNDIKDEYGISYLIITHDIGVVEYIADRLAVMYLGNVVEVGPTERVLDDAAHPYTRALLSTVPKPDPRRKDGHAPSLLPGEIPSPKNPPSGCRFHTRCAYSDNGLCRTVMPKQEWVDESHAVYCHRWRTVRG